MSLMVTVGLFLLAKILDLRSFIGSMQGGGMQGQPRMMMPQQQMTPPPPQVPQATPRPGMGPLPVAPPGAMPPPPQTPTKEGFYYKA